MEITFSIRFGKELSPEYPAVLRYSSKFRKYYPAGDGNSSHVIETSNHEIMGKYELFTQLMVAIRDWNSAVIEIDGSEIKPSQFMLAEKDQISSCYKSYLSANDKDSYCDVKSPECWGCRLFSGIVLRHEKSAFNKHSKYWYQYGAFTDNHTWRINRDELARSLEDIVKRNSIDYCPVFQYYFFRRYISALPALIHLPDPANWESVYRNDIGNSSKRWEPISIKHILQGESSAESRAKFGLTMHKAKDETASDARHLRNVPLTTFADIGGVDEIIHNIRIMIELPLKKPKLFEQLGVKPYRGILLWGEPGNGKTLIAKAIAHEVNAHFIPIAGPDILSKDFGQSECNLRSIFDEAKEHQPSVIFIDEIDAIAQTRFSGEAGRWYTTLVNQLLALMDGIGDFGNVTVLASTNRPDLLDPALLRPGRFDYKLEIRKPNLPGCKRILEIATKGMPLADDVDLFAYSEAVAGYSAAEITFLAKEAAMTRLRKSIENDEISLEAETDEDYSSLQINMDDFHVALHMLKWHRRYANLTYSLKDKKPT